MAQNTVVSFKEIGYNEDNLNHSGFFDENLWSLAINENLAQTQWSVINEMGNNIIQASWINTNLFQKETSSGEMAEHQ